MVGGPHARVSVEVARARVRAADRCHGSSGQEHLRGCPGRGPASTRGNLPEARHLMLSDTPDRAAAASRRPLGGVEVIHFLVHNTKDTVGVVVVEGVKTGQELTGWLMEDDATLNVTALDDIPIGH